MHSSISYLEVVRGKLAGLCSFQHVGPRDRTQVGRLGGEHCYPPSCRRNFNYTKDDWYLVGFLLVLSFLGQSVARRPDTERGTQGDFGKGCWVFQEYRHNLSSQCWLLLNVFSWQHPPKSSYKDSLCPFLVQIGYLASDPLPSPPISLPWFLWFQGSAGDM